MPAEFIIESIDAGVGVMIDLFEVDLQLFGGDVIRSHSGTHCYYAMLSGKVFNIQPIQS